MAHLPAIAAPYVPQGHNEETYPRPATHEHQLSARVQRGSHERRVISISGGGVRGILPALFLEALSKQAHNTPVYQLADLFAGTSTGALIVGTLNIPGDRDGAKFTASDLVKLFETKSSAIFHKSFCHTIASVDGWVSAKYEAEDLYAVVQSVAGTTLLKDANKDLYIPSWDRNSQKLFVFTRAEARSNIFWNKLPLWVAVAGSASAETYFQALHAKISKPRINPDKPAKEPKNRQLIDGGNSLNDPISPACAETMRLWDINTRDLRVLSLLTGQTKYKMPDDDAGKLGYASNISTILIDGNMDASEDSAKRLLAGNKDFYRVQHKIPLDKSQLDDVKAIPYFKDVIFKSWIDEVENQDKVRAIANVFYKPAREAGEAHAHAESDAVV